MMKSSKISIASGTRPSYDIALSFASENRSYAHELATRLREKRLCVFFYESEDATQRAPDAAEYLRQIYERGADCCVILFSADWLRKPFCTIEWMAVIEAMAREPDMYITFLVCLDTSELPKNQPEGIRCMDAQQQDSQKIADRIAESLPQRDVDSLWVQAAERWSSIASGRRMLEGETNEIRRRGIQRELAEEEKRLGRMCSRIIRHVRKRIQEPKGDRRGFLDNGYTAKCRKVRRCDNTITALNHSNDLAENLRDGDPNQPLAALLEDFVNATKADERSRMAAYQHFLERHKGEE